MLFFFFFKQKTAYEISACLVGSEMCIRDRYGWSDLEKLGERITDEQFRAVFDSVDPQDVTNMQYTSGTTGFPKGVMLTHYNIVNNGKCIGDCMKFTHEDRLCIPVPFFHCFGLVLAVMACLTHASSMVPIETYLSLIHISEPTRQAEISYAVFCLKKKKKKPKKTQYITTNKKKQATIKKKAILQSENKML